MRVSFPVFQKCAALNLMYSLHHISTHNKIQSRNMIDAKGQALKINSMCEPHLCTLLLQDINGKAHAI